MTPGEARDRVLGDHARLRGLIRLVRERLGDSVAAYEACVVLFDELLEHIDMEDRVVGELLTRLDATALPTQAELLEEHVEQRAWIEQTRAAMTQPGRADLLESIRDFLTMLEAEMVLEEETLVSALEDYDGSL